MNDCDIRKALLSYLTRQYAADASILVVEEVPVCNKGSRVDVAVVGESLHGYEIKSQLDGLGRLSGQLLNYARVFDEVTLVVGLRHLGHMISELPAWCGISTAQSIAGEVTLEIFRLPAKNLDRDPYWLAQMLWREEALAVLSKRGADWGVRTKPREAIWERIANLLSVEEIASEVRQALRTRQPAWRPNLFHTGLLPPGMTKRRLSRRRRARRTKARKVV